MSILAGDGIEFIAELLDKGAYVTQEKKYRQQLFEYLQLAKVKENIVKL
jgi:hypothetical protein